jgi:cytosine/adenosine deaminase-related metal-dependent hydrolase
MRSRRLAARWIIPVEGPPIPRGALLIGTDGRIAELGPDTAVPRPPEALAEAFDDAVILPGLVNTHTHLELTGFEGRVTEPEFPAWIRRLRDLKTTRTPAEYLEASRRGLQACFASGVTTVADTGDSGSVFQALTEAGSSGVVYQEVFGPDPRQVNESLLNLQAAVDRIRFRATSRVGIGVSPHAPYTVSGDLFRAVARWAKTEQLPLAVHVAESAAESEFLLRGSGPFADAWRARGIPLPFPAGRTPVQWLEEHDVLTERTLCIHAVQLDEEDINRLARSGAAVAHCPRSNVAHAHGSARLAELLGHGVPVGLGTDSVVSVGTLDLLAEARAASRLAPALTADQLIELCTLAGARVLGMDREIGSLRPGKWADCTVLQISANSGGNPAGRVLACEPDDVLRTYVGGKEVYRSR